MSRLFALVALSVLLSGCQHLRRVNLSSSGPIIKQDPCANLDPYEISRSQEYFLGRTTAAQVVARYGAQNVLSPSDPLSRYVRKVGNAVASVAGEKIGDTELARYGPRSGVRDREWPLRGYHFVVVESAVPNAHGMPGGFVVVTTGLLRLSRSEDELAGVLAHEVAHVQRGHGVEVVKRAMCDTAHANDGLVGYFRSEVSRTETGLLGHLAGNRGALTQLFDAGVESWNDHLAKGYGSDLEFESDALAARYVALAGYSARGLADVLHRMPVYRGGGLFSGGLFATHPEKEKRIPALFSVIRAAGIPERVPTEERRQVRFREAFVRLAACERRDDAGAGGD
jgi:predicted Zn-dependent protease